METDVNSVVLAESESFWPRFKRRMKRKNKRQSSRPSPSANYAVEISPTRLISGESAALVTIGSISRDGGFIPVILSPVGKAISNERQPKKKKKKKPLGFDTAEIKVKSRDAGISVKSRDSEVGFQELAPIQISEEKDEVAVRKLGRRSWVRIAKAFRFSTGPDLLPTRQSGVKVSQDSHQEGRAKETETPVIEQHKGQAIRQENEVADSIPGLIDEPYMSSRTSRSRKLLKSIDFNKKVSSHASAPNTPFKRPGIKSAALCSSSSYCELRRPDINSTTPNSQPKKLNMSPERRGTITGDATAEGEGYDTAINFSVLIIIVGCLTVFSDRLLAVACTSLWWYLLPSLLKRNRESTSAAAAAAAAGVNNGRSALKHPRRRIFFKSLSDVNARISNERSQ